MHFRKQCLSNFLQSVVKIIILLYFKHFRRNSCTTRRFRTTSTQWKQTASSTDVIMRISTVSPVLPLLPLTLSFIQWGQEKAAEGRQGETGTKFHCCTSASTDPLAWTHNQVQFCFQSLGRTVKMIKLMLQHAKKHPGVGWIILSVDCSNC